jgi:hypothetical protein
LNFAEEVILLRIPTVLATVLTLAAVSSASAQERTKVGTLDCAIAPGVGFVVGSSKHVDCAFAPSQAGWRGERYVGTINKFGVDIGVTSGGRLLWAVYAPTTSRKWALAGRYGGATAEATVGAGLGANALYGGSHQTVSLQPLSVQGQSGLNVAGGVAELTLDPAPAPKARRHHR